MAKRPIYYDTETTGIKSDKDRIIEIAAYDPVQDRTFSELVNPERPIGPESIEITGITDEMVANARTFKDVGKDFFEFCSGETFLIAHNNDSFDKRFLENEAKRSSIHIPNFSYIDTLKWSRKYRTDLPRHSLQYLREIYGIEKNNAHRALDDVYVLYKVFSLMIEDLPIQHVYDLLYKSTNLVRQMPFGKHRGEPLAKLPKHYLKWLAGSGALDKPENELLKKSMEKLSLI